MYNSILEQYATQGRKEDVINNSPTPINSIQAIIDPRFNALINRATTSAKSNQISPELHNYVTSPNTTSPKSLNLLSPKVNKRQILSPAWKYRLQGIFIILVIAAITVGIVLSIILTRSSSSSSGIITTTNILSSCNTLQWNPIGITLFGDGTSGSSSNQLNDPRGVFVDANDTVYVADSNNHRILKLSSGSNGTMNATVIAGVTSVSTLGSTTLNFPVAVYVDSQKNLYIADTYNNRVQFWAYGAQNGSTVAGSSSGCYSLIVGCKRI